MKECIIWGIAPNKDHEEPLHTKSETMEQAQNVAKILENEHGCKNTRIQVLDLENADIVQMFADSVNM